MMSTSASRSSLAANASPMRRTADCSRLRSRMASCRRLWACSMRAWRSRASSMSSAASGRTSSTAAGWRLAARPARKPIGARQASTHHDVREHLELQLRRDAARGRFAQRGGAASKRQQHEQRGAQQRKVGEVELRRAGEDEHERRPEGVPRVGDREEQAQRGAAAAEPGRRGARGPGRRPPAAGRWPAAASSEHRDEHELRREARSPRRPGTRRARRARTARRARRPTREVEAGRAPGTKQQRDGRRAGTARRPRARSASSRRSTPRERVSHESSRRRSAASSLRMSSAVVGVMR